MTNEEATKNLKKLKSFHNGSYGTAIDMAIKALEQQPCEDCISRKEVLKYIDKMPSELTSDGRRMIRRRTLEEYISDTLPSVTPRTNLAETSRDCISRQAVIDYAKDTCLDLDKHEDTEVFCDEIKAMPSVKPKYTDEEIDRAQAVEQAYVDKMVELTVKETKRPKGKWIEVLEWRTEFSSAWHYECSECRARSYKGYKPLERYCPKCGAEMSGGGEDGYSN